jgi:hypothetical protein
MIYDLSLLGGGPSKDAVLPGRGSLIGSNILLGIKWFHSGCVILKSMFVVLLIYLRLSIIKLTFGWSRAFFRGATLDEVVVVAQSWLSIPASIAGGNARVARKIEQLLAERRNISSLMMQSSSFTFLNALVKNAIHVVAGFRSTTVPHLAWCLNVCAHFDFVWTYVGC